MEIFGFYFLILIISYINSGTVDFKSFDLDSVPKDIIWCGASSDAVLALTELSSVYRSDDKGFTWKKLNDIILSTGKNELEPNENEVFNYLIIMT